MDKESNKTDDLHLNVIIREDMVPRRSGTDITTYTNELCEIFINLPSEIRHFGRIPCAQRSLYTGIIVGGVVSAFSLVITGPMMDAGEGVGNGNSDEYKTPSGITDPTGRFERTNELLGRGASKEVYKAFDHEEGVEVAWNHLKVDHLSEQTAAKILSEIQILTQLDNENIIKFYHSWLRHNGAGNYDVFFITELMTSGTLKNYLQKTKGPIKLKVIKNWCRQILRALLYLHSKDPPIIHRDLKCDNIFINGNNGQAKLGDFGLAVLKSREMLNSVLGTPEFMAPELYEENYDEKIDVYAFGMGLLEMITKDYPYSECENAAQIFRRVTTGVKPQALGRVSDPETLNFIELCIDADPKKRPSVSDLLNHEFMMVFEEGKAINSANLESAIVNHLSTATSPSESVPINSPMAMAATETLPISANISGLILRNSTPSEPPKLIHCLVEIISVEWPTLQLKMKLQMSVANASKEVKFPFNLENDTVGAVVDEMMKESVLDESARIVATSAISDCLKESLTKLEISRPDVQRRTDSALTAPHKPVDILPLLIPTIQAPNGDVLSTISSISTQTIPLVSSTTTSELSSNLLEVIDDSMIQDHPEVAALLLRQKKEIELLALFHRREYQTLLKNLRRQVSNRTRTDSATNGTILPKPTIPGQREQLNDLEESQFMSKVRHLLYESTGNAAWLPDIISTAPNNFDGSSTI